MDIFRYIVRFLYKIRWYLTILPLIALVVAWFATRNLEKTYRTETTIYTGMITGYNIEGGSGSFGGNPQTNIQNLLFIIQSESTIHDVALKLFARVLVHGNATRNNNVITAEHYRELIKNVPRDILSNVDKSSEENTFKMLKQRDKNISSDFLTGLLNSHPYFRVKSISENLKPHQIPGTDIIHIEYTANDQGICFNTLDILNKVFGEQYKLLRFGETMNVIKFFEREAKKLHTILKYAEDDLVHFNEKNKIINYGEQSKQLTILEMQLQTAHHDRERSEATTDALLAYLEAQMEGRDRIIQANEQFTTMFTEISRLQSRIANLQLMSSENGGNNLEAQTELNKAKNKLQSLEEQVKELSRQIEKETYTPNTGVKVTQLTSNWLEQKLEQTKTRAERTVEDKMKQRLDEKYNFYSPIGATLAQKERHISFIEGNYMEMLKSLNTARLRQKNLQMTTATLRVLNPPVFPMDAQSANRMMYLLGAFMITFVLTSLFFFIIEMLDRTLRDRMRSERITQIPVLGCYPRESSLRYRRFNKTVSDMALRQLSKALLPFFQEGQQNVLNLLSTDAGNGKSYLAQELENYWVSIGLRVRRLTYDEDFLAEDSRYILAKDIKDLCPDIQPDEIAIVEYPNLDDNTISSALLNMGTVNLMVTRANRTWKDVDQKALKELQSRLKDQNTLYMYLTEASRYAVEEFVGQLPPYTRFNNFVYRISQLGLTAVENSHAR